MSAASTFFRRGLHRIFTTANPVARWWREQIRAARKAPLALLLRARGLELRELEASNLTLPQTHSGLLLKDNYWRWPERQLAGNTIDFFTQILGLTFRDAMLNITANITASI